MQAVWRTWVYALPHRTALFLQAEVGTFKHNWPLAPLAWPCPCVSDLPRQRANRSNEAGAGEAKEQVLIVISFLLDEV